MKLYATSTTSPFTCRVRLAVYARGLDVEICPVPNDDWNGAEYRAINPLGRIPALLLDSGSSIIESEVIIEYFEDRFPERSLRPTSPEDRAQARMISRFCDLYVLDKGISLAPHLDPAGRDEAFVEATFAAIDTQLGYLNGFLGAGPYAVGETLSTADCALATTLAALHAVALHFGRPPLLTDHARLAAYLQFVASNPHVARVLGEAREGLATRLTAA